MELQIRLEEMAKSLGAFYFGVADLSLTRGGPLTPYEKRLTSEYPLAISIGVPLSPETVNRIEDPDEIPELQAGSAYLLTDYSGLGDGRSRGMDV